MNGSAYSSAAKVRRVGSEIPRPDPQGDPRLRWTLRPEAWTPWNWDETLDQFQTFRKTKSQIR